MNNTQSDLSGYASFLKLVMETLDAAEVEYLNDECNVGTIITFIRD